MASLLAHTGPLGTQRAAHLLRRCSYNISRARIDAFALLTADAAVEQLFVPTSLFLDEPICYENGLPWINSGAANTLSNTRLRNYVRAWSIDESRRDLSIISKLAFFLHTNWVISADAPNNYQLFDYFVILRHFTTGSFKELAKKMTIDNAMLDYLNGHDNSKFNPNENYAREFFELFTIGKGPQIGPGNYTHYTEEDIGEASKLLSGFRKSTRPLGGDPQYWDATIGAQFGYANYSRHDTTDKTFSSAFSSQTITGAVDADDMYRELDDFVEMVFAKDETAKNICRKLYRYFVSKNITTEIENDIILPLATSLKNNNYIIGPIVKELLKSQHFFDDDDTVFGDELLGGIVKSPLDTILQTMTFFEVAVPDVFTQTEDHYQQWYTRSLMNSMLLRAGMTIYKPDSVAGYPAYYQAPSFSENWFNGSTLIARYKFGEMLLTGRRVLDGGDLGGVELDIVDFIHNSGLIADPSDSAGLVNTLCTYLFAAAPTVDRFDYFLNDIFLDELSPINWANEWSEYLNTGTDTSVRIALERLVSALISSQEYQLS